MFNKINETSARLTSSTFDPNIKITIPYWAKYDFSISKKPNTTKIPSTTPKTIAIQTINNNSETKIFNTSIIKNETIILLTKKVNDSVFSTFDEDKTEIPINLIIICILSLLVIVLIMIVIFLVIKKRKSNNEFIEMQRFDRPPPPSPLTERLLHIEF